MGRPSAIVDFQVGHCFDTRYIVNIKPGPSAESMSTIRRWSTGRLTAHYDEGVNNEWLQKSVLAIVGKPDGEVVLPAQNRLLVPEDVNTNKDIRFSERKRFHVEQVVAQKGPDFAKLLLKSLVEGMEFTASTPVVVVNIAPYVEDCGRAMISLKTDVEENWVNAANTVYVSLHQNKMHHDWSVQNIKDVLETKWIEGNLKTPGFELNGLAPRVDNVDLSSLGKQRAEAVKGNLDVLEWEVLVKDGMRFAIKDEHVQRWTSAPLGFRNEFTALQTKHNEMYRDLFINVTFLSPNYDGNDTDTAIVPAVAEAGAEFDTLAALKEAHTIKCECVSKVAGVSIMITEEKAIFLHSQKDRVLPAKTIVGGIGNGMYQGFVENVQGVKIELPDGDKTFVEIDKTDIDGSPPEIMLLSQVFHWLEKQGKSSHKISFFTVSRNAAGGGYALDVDEGGAQMFKVLSSEEVDRIQGGQPPTKKKKADITASTIFGNAVQVIPTANLQIVWRFRVLVGKNLKIVKPYVMTKAAINLKANKPQQAPHLLSSHAVVCR